MAVQIMGYDIPVISCNTAVVGSGAAGLNAADRLYHYGMRDCVLVTEDRNAGTSRNTGSDKQTYYKLSLAGNEPDSVRRMAEVLYSGGCVDGDIALCEAALSASCFLRLAELGVQFPQNRYGEYIGYKTDHDPARRASSAGPYTSKQMTERLEAEVMKNGTRIFDGFQVIRILTADGETAGLLCLDVKRANEKGEISYLLINCRNIIYASGGPAGIYADSVYPESQSGATGLAFEAGAEGRNLTEWQYGLASLKPRWNVSGTYMQAIPAFISTDQDGGNEREFLREEYEDDARLCSDIFLKGYQWPFDVNRLNGSSRIDLLIYRETKEKGRRVFLDYRTNPGGKVPYESLLEEAAVYLENAGARFGRPVDRLIHMNRPAYEFFLEHGVDLREERLEISLCAQHNNGGLAVDCWWRTNIPGLFAAGEVSATHGVRRPGGTALNAGQVGSVRAAQYISARRTGTPPDEEVYIAKVVHQVRERIEMAERAFQNALAAANTAEAGKGAGAGSCSAANRARAAALRMSHAGAAIRNTGEMESVLRDTGKDIEHFREIAAEKKDAGQLFRTWDILLCQRMYLAAMMDYRIHGGKSRGGAWYPEDGTEVRDRENSTDGLIQEGVLEGNETSFTWRQPRTMPDDDDFFENVWREYRTDKNIR